MKTQTAVEWLEEQFEESYSYINEIFKDTFEQAKQMEKEQIKKLLEIIMWYDEESDVRPNTEIYNWFKQYYNETYKSE